MRFFLGRGGFLGASSGDDLAGRVWEVPVRYQKKNKKGDNVTNVLAPYSDRMKKLLDDPEGFYEPKKRPSGHDISMGFGKNNGGNVNERLAVFAFIKCRPGLSTEERRGDEIPEERVGVRYV